MAETEGVRATVFYEGPYEDKFLKYTDASEYLKTLGRRDIAHLRRNAWEGCAASDNYFLWLIDKKDPRAIKLLNVVRSDEADGNDGDLAPEADISVSFDEYQGEQWFESNKPEPTPAEKARAEKAKAKATMILTKRKAKASAIKAAIKAAAEERKRKAEEKKSLIEEARRNKILKAKQAEFERMSGLLSVKRVPMLD